MSFARFKHTPCAEFDGLINVDPALFQRPFDARTPARRVLDLFAGAGGFSLGFEAAGAHIKAAIEIDKWACETLSDNHPHTNVVECDISRLDDDELLKIGEGCDIIIGGPPCQGFSIANKNAGDPDDPRNSLFREFLRAVRLIKPAALLMENVPGLLKRKSKSGKPVIDIIVEELSALGYVTEFKIIEAQAFGVPQLRPRLFVVGYRQKPHAPFPEATHGIAPASEDLFSPGLQTLPYVTLWDAISDLPDLEARQGAETMPYSATPQNSFQALLRADSQVLYNNVAMRHSARMVERFSHVKCGNSGVDVPAEHLARQRGDNTKISEKFYSQNNRRMHPDRPCHTIPASFYANFIHPFKHRNFTPREGARLQSFPDWYKFSGKPTVVSNKLLSREDRDSELHLCQYNQIGNAVPPLLAYNLAKHILLQLKSV